MMTVSASYLILSYTILLRLCVSLYEDVKIGVQSDSYYVDEFSGTVRVCAAIFEGCLERDIEVEYGTVDGHAKSKYQ